MYVSIFGWIDIDISMCIYRVPLCKLRFAHGRRCSVRPHTVRRLRLALGDGMAKRVGVFPPLKHNHPVSKLTFTRYCHHQYCMVFDIQGGGRWAGVYCAMVVQSYYNRAGFAGGGGVLKG